MRSRLFRCASRSEILRLTVGSGTPSLRPAAERLPASTAESKSDMASRRSTTLPKSERKRFDNTILLFSVECHMFGVSANSSRPEEEPAHVPHQHPDPRICALGLKAAIG